MFHSLLLLLELLSWSCVAFTLLPCLSGWHSPHVVSPLLGGVFMCRVWRHQLVTFHQCLPGLTQAMATPRGTATSTSTASTTSSSTAVTAKRVVNQLPQHFHLLRVGAAREQLRPLAASHTSQRQVPRHNTHPTTASSHVMYQVPYDFPYVTVSANFLGGRE